MSPIHLLTRLQTRNPSHPGFTNPGYIFLITSSVTSSDVALPPMSNVRIFALAIVLAMPLMALVRLTILGV
ncbi:MAG TPA: hypothetical protein ENH10_00685 [Bacteroidetes bacterium]|nr:hypothetical protein [Bacteroidota bacterium]HEX03661.1 hypothetical protein [Bacteroidota bacterium]